MCAGSIVVRDELVDGVCRGERERGEAERLTEEETQAWRAVDVEFGLEEAVMRRVYEIAAEKPQGVRIKAMRLGFLL